MTYLVTGAMGCIGAWTVAHLAQRGEHVIALDKSDDRHRLDLLLSREEQEPITFITGDIVDTQRVQAVVGEHGVTHIIHLAALQVPFCRANPVLGAQVNVVGTINLFEAAKNHSIDHITYASSIAVYGPPERYPEGLIAHDAPLDPHTHYGVYKQANEGTARIYWQNDSIGSTALRPYIVYGVGRDQGLTSDPTKAMQAAAVEEPAHIDFGGTAQMQFASDVARQFILAADSPAEGALAFNLGTTPVTMTHVAELIEERMPETEVTVNQERTLPFPAGFDDTALRQHAETVFATPLAEGIAQTIQHFRRGAAER